MQWWWCTPTAIHSGNLDNVSFWTSSWELKVTTILSLCPLRGPYSNLITAHIAVICLPVAQWWRICLLMQETKESQVQSLGWEDPLGEKMEPAPVFLPGKSHEQRRLVGYSSWGRKESDTTEWLHSLTHSLMRLKGAWHLCVPRTIWSKEVILKLVCKHLPWLWTLVPQAQCRRSR